MTSKRRVLSRPRNSAENGGAQRLHPVCTPELRANRAASAPSGAADSTGNLVDAFDDHDAALAALIAIVTAEPEAAEDVFLVGQDDEGHMVGETIYGSSLVAA